MDSASYPETNASYAQASIKTADNLRTIAHTVSGQLTSLTLPEIENAVDIISKVMPAGNVPGMILTGLARLPERRPPPQIIKRDIQLLFRGVEQILDKAVYSTFFAGPAAIIWGYQNLLKLAGKSPEDAFPEGVWQFYVEYALREDTARHANETHGFDTLLRQHGIQLQPVDRLSAWAMTAIQTLHEYPALLENEWYERVSLRLLTEHTANSTSGDRLGEVYRQWEKLRPYARRADAGTNTYPVYRRRLFERFLHERISSLPHSVLDAWQRSLSAARERQFPTYLRQMSILSCLDPGDFAETRIPTPLQDVHIGIVWKGAYFFVPASDPQTGEFPNSVQIRAQIAAIMSGQISALPVDLSELRQLKRSHLAHIWSRLPRESQSALESFRHTPILIHADARDRRLPLAEIRQAERGIGSHALTVFDTGETFVFDQSHIYFDGAWGASLAEIMTNEALSWARYLATLPSPKPNPSGMTALRLTWSETDLQILRRGARTVPEVSAETDQVNIKAILGLRRLFKARSDLVQLTVNDLLILYRAIHGLTYQPSEQVTAALKRFYPDSAQALAARRAAEGLSVRDNPAILIPIDASQASPSERLYPMSFEVPLSELDFLRLHDRTLQALNAYENSSGDRAALYEAFDHLQREYLATLAAFGALLTKAKEIALSGESASVGTIKLLAHMPKPLQRLLDDIPSRFDILNDLIKGREVFSNIGAVASSSTLTRFITAKDDNEQKTLAWGAITTASGMMVLTLRDFRPYITALTQVGLKSTAQLITQDYIDAYANGLNRYVRELRHITLASRETRVARGDI